MDDRFSILSQQVFNKSLSEFSVDELVAITEQNPYFTAAQILLLKKLQKGSEAYNSQYQKAILYYHDPVAFDYLIHRDDFETDVNVLTDTEVEEPIEQKDTDSEVSSVYEIPVNPVEAESKKVSDDLENYMDDMRSAITIEREKPDTLTENEPTEKSFFEEKTETENHYQATPEILSDPLEPVEEPQVVEQELHATVPDEFLENDQISEQVVKIEKPSHPEPEFQAIDEEKVAETIIDNVSENQPDLPLIKEEKEKDLLFEPFHTVDYFASQGIKVTQEEAPKDKFGKQLKSFTEWLKTMKRLPAAEMASVVEKSTEQKIENLAADSVNSADVVTEAMAEVWLRQGNEQKAMEIYNKLILLYPSKSAYFAAKIDSLKKQN